MDHLALTYIMKSKTELTSARIKNTTKGLISYSFNLYYIEEKNMTLIDVLSGVKVDKSNPYGIIPISFDLQEVLEDRYYIHPRSQKANTTVGKNMDMINF